ncbi:MAG: ribonuclease PH [Candidatus Latescibacteria bacterium]|nr:ribonuclease PH [Candidatus Latescibacterota bacterium]
MSRADGRDWNQPRKIEFIMDYLQYAEGSCLAIAGNTKVLCAASFETRVPPYLVGSGQGWITAEYSLLPRSTHQRTLRESTVGKLQGRNQEIRRFLGRSLRAICNLFNLGENQIIIDCDVIQADGGTRTLALNGAFCALSRCVANLLANNRITKNPIIEHVGAISVGLVQQNILLDLDYSEDSQAETDMNIVLTETNRIVELQATAERQPFTFDDFNKMFSLAKTAIKQIIEQQKNTLKGPSLK